MGEMIWERADPLYWVVFLGPKTERDTVMGSLGPEIHRGARGWDQKTKGSPFVRGVSSIHPPQRTLRLSEMTQNQVKFSGTLPEIPLLFSKAINLQHTHGRKGL